MTTTPDIQAALDDLKELDRWLNDIGSIHSGTLLHDRLRNAISALQSPAPDDCDRVIRMLAEVLRTASDTIAAFEPSLPTKKLHDHGRWQRTHIRKALSDPAVVKVMGE